MTVLAELVSLFSKVYVRIFFLTRSLIDRCQMVTDTCKNNVSKFVWRPFKSPLSIRKWKCFGEVSLFNLYHLYFNYHLLAQKTVLFMEDLVVSTALNHSGSFGKNFAKLKTNKYIIYRLRIGSYGEKLWPRSQFFTTRTSQPANNIYLYMTCTALHVSYVVIYQAKIPVRGPYLLTQPGPFKAVKPPVS